MVLMVRAVSAPKARPIAERSDKIEFFMLTDGNDAVKCSLLPNDPNDGVDYSLSTEMTMRSQC